jgi:plastocyanin
MRPPSLVIPIALLALVTACSTSSTPVDQTTAPATTTAAPTTAATTEAAPTTSAGPAQAGGAASGATLTGALGANDGFIITLVDDKGAPVTTLKAGSYQVKIKDTSKIHNFHLTGPGVDETTTVPELKDITWPVTFKAGTYTYQCDPHPNMKHTFTVN